MKHCFWFVFAPFALALAMNAADAPPTVEEARTFIEKAEARLLELSNHSSRASWVQATYITVDTEVLAAKASQDLISATVELAKQATRFDKLNLPEDLARKMKLLKVALTLPAPSDPKLAEELTRITTRLESTYGKGKY